MQSDDFTTKLMKSIKKTKKDDFNRSLDNIKNYCNNLELWVNSLEEENQKLKDEHYNDSELQKMQLELEKMQKRVTEIRKSALRGFPINEDEEVAIKQWEEDHDRDVHGLTTLDLRCKAGGCSGGRYTYKFVPTSLGVIGKVVCSCGAEFQFQDFDYQKL